MVSANEAIAERFNEALGTRVAWSAEFGSTNKYLQHQDPNER